MPNHQLSMPRIKQVLRCYAAGKGTKSISSLLDISRNTVKEQILFTSINNYKKQEMTAENINIKLHLRF